MSGHKSVWLLILSVVFIFYFYFKNEFVAEVQHPQVSWVPGTTEFFNQYWLMLGNRREVYLYSDVLTAYFLLH